MSLDDHYYAKRNPGGSVGLCSFAYGGFYPQSMTSTANMTAKLSCDNCNRLLKALEDVSKTAFHWQALGIAQDALKPAKESK